MHEVIGWIGALLYIIAYFLISIKKLQADQVAFQLLNILGGVCLIVNSMHQSDYPSVFTNGVWRRLEFLRSTITKENKGSTINIRRVKLLSACTTFSFNMVTKLCFAFFTAKAQSTRKVRRALTILSSALRNSAFFAAPC